MQSRIHHANVVSLIRDIDDLKIKVPCLESDADSADIRAQRARASASEAALLLRNKRMYLEKMLADRKAYGLCSLDDRGWPIKASKK